MTSSPLLALDAVRVVSLDPSPSVLAVSLSLSLVGPHGALLGDAEPVLGPLLRRARVADGSFALRGVALDQVDPASVGLVPLDLPLPPALTPLDYVTWSARLAGLSPDEASRRAREQCQAMGLGAWASQPLGSLHAVYHRLTLLAHALLLDPAVLVIEAPLAGLDPAAAGYVLEAVKRACAGRAALISSPPAEPGSPAAALLDGCDERVELPATPA